MARRAIPITERSVPMSVDTAQRKFSGELYGTLSTWLAGRLRAPLRALFDTVDDSLFELAEHSMAGERQQRYFDGMRECRRQRALVEQRFGDAIAAGQLLPARRRDGAHGDLGLVGHEELEEEIAVTAMASKAQQRYAGPLFPLTQRVALLLGEPGLEVERNPFGPATLAERFREAIAALDVDLEVRLIVLKLFERHVIGALEPLYGELDRRLAEAGVMPAQGAKSRRNARMQPAARASATATPEPHSLREAPGHAYGSAGVDSEQELVATVLDVLLARLASSGGAAPGPRTGGGFPVAGAGQGALLHALDDAIERTQARLREGGPLPPPRHLAAQLMAEARYATGGHAPPQQMVVVEMIGRVFEALLNDRRVPGPLQPILQRMQVPLTRASLRDAGELAQRDSPMRQLVDLLGDIAIGWCPSADPRGRLLAQLEDFVDSLGASRTADERSRIVERLRSALEVQQRRAELAEQRVVEAAAGRERLWHARHQVHQALAAKLAAAPVPAWVRQLLTRPWANCMVLLWLRQGEGSSAYRDAMGFAESVLWVANAGADPTHRARLHALLPVLDGQLRRGLATVAYHEGEIELLAGQLHDLIRWRLGDIPAPDFLEHTPPDSAGAESSHEALADIAADQPTPEDIDPGLLERLRSTPPGTWFEFTPLPEGAEAGHSERAKLTWISPYSGRCLFVNRNGMRVADRRPEELAREFEQGLTRILESANLLQEAMTAVLEQLRGDSPAPRRTPAA